MQKRCWQFVVLTITLVSSQHVLAQEVSAFKLTEFNGDIVLRYLHEEEEASVSGIVNKDEKRPAFQEEVQFSTSSYVYHPNLLRMDISAGLLLDQSSSVISGEKNSTDKELINLNSRFQFLEKKPYPITLYYNKQSPSANNTETGRYIQEDIRYGIDAAIMKPVSPVLVSLKAFRQSLQGEGIGQIIDEEKDQATLRLYSSPGAGTHMELTHQESQQVSSSGSPNLTITPRESDRSETNFSSRDHFGNNEQIQLSTSLSKKTQDQFPQVEGLTFAPLINWKHNKSFDSFYRLDFADNKEVHIVDLNQQILEATQKKASTGVMYHSDVTNTGFRIRVEENETSNINSEVTGVNYNFSRKVPLSSGGVQFSFNSLYDMRDQVQVSGSSGADVFGESHVLNGLEAVTLHQQNIDTSTIRVFNENRTQEYIQGSDFVFQVLGNSVLIWRSASGNILDGQIVLVDYHYETGGTFAYDMATNNANINWSWRTSYNFYLRYQDTNIKEEKGNPTIKLNSINSITAGIRINKAFLNGVEIGGELYQEDRDEDINPYIKKNIETYIDLPLPSLTNLRITTQRQTQENENFPYDIDLVAASIYIKSRPWLRGTMSWETRYQNDEGGLESRLMLRHRLRLSWGVRQLSLSASLSYSKERQAADESERLDALLTASRRF